MLKLSILLGNVNSARIFTAEIMEESIPTKQHSMKCPKLYGKECLCDSYHTFGELYEHRFRLFISLCRLVEEKYHHQHKPSPVWRSKLHSDGTKYDGWFILGIYHNERDQITYHLPMEKWKETDWVITQNNAPEYDGHTSDDVLERLKTL